MSQPPYDVAHLDAIERSGRGDWIPIRRRLGVSAFGVNAWAGDEGAAVIGEHDESSLGHEELYVVVSGRARFTVGGETIDGAPGTLVFVRDPAVKRAAVAVADATVVLTVGAPPGKPFSVSPWEVNADILPLFERGDFAEAKRRLEAAVAEYPDAGGLLFNLACAEARLGESDAALGHLRRAVEIEPGFAGYAQEDDDLAPLRDDPRFPAPVAR